MGVQIDLIVPPIIVGLLIIAVIRLNAFIMETSIDNRLTNDMQMFADVATRLIQEEVKLAEDIIKPINPDTPDSILTFLSTAGDSVFVQRSGVSLQIIKISGIVSDTLLYPLNLSSLEFDLVRKPAGEPTPYYLNFKIETESDPDHHATFNGDPESVRGFSESEIYLRNIHLNSL